MKENKKLVKTVSDIASQSAKEYAVLKEQNKNIVKSLKKRWDESEPIRKIIETNAKNDLKKIAKGIKKNSKTLIKKSIQFKKDVVKGVKAGLKKKK
jgi:hypothetical protein